MFCAECGTKNENGAQFCENCGNKLEVITPTESTTTVAPQPGKSFSTRIKEMSTKNKIISAIAIVLVVALIAGYVVLNNMTKPEKVAEEFFNATMSYDADAMYGFLDVDKSEFTTKEIFKKITEKDIEDEDIPKVMNYTVGKPLTSNDGLSTTVTITYVLEGVEGSKTADIKLVKDKKKKWLLFDNWKVNVTGTDTLKGYKIKVMKDSKVTIEGIEVDKKYIDKKESTDSLDVYSMPAMFETNYSILINLPIGIKIEDDFNVNEYSSYTYRLSLSSLSDKMKENLNTAVKTNWQILYNGVKDKKSFDEIKSSFEYEGADLTDLKDVYEDLSGDISTDITLTKVEAKEVTLSSLDTTSDGNIEVYAKVKFDYSLTYQSGEETKTNDSDDYDYIYLTFDYVNDEFKLVDASSLNSYFSKYY